jgi:predicted RNA-binding Zn-ribbon protein involved in translation (DUF1610 family)/TM2 domain-containing membrane protein YozV
MIQTRIYLQKLKEQYLKADSVSEKHESSSTGSHTESSSSKVYCTKCGNEITSNSHFCPNCGTKVEEVEKDRFCGRCGKQLPPQAQTCPNCGKFVSQARQEQSTTNQQNSRLVRPIEWKSESVTLLLSILLGLFGIQGVGHMYVGKIGKGVVILIGSLVLLVISIALTVTGIGAIIGIPLIIVYIVMFIWQIIDARKLCQQYNDHLEKHGSPPT